jgi:hypothetical protein
MTTKPPTLDEILAQAEDPAFVRVATARILLRQDFADRHVVLDAALEAAVRDDARLNRTPEAPGIARQIGDLEAETEAAKVEFKFRAIGRRAWADLMSQHPPTKEQLKVSRHWDHNPETFPSAAMAASCFVPDGMTVEAMRRLEVSLNDTQYKVLWAACLEANTGVDVPKSPAAGAILRLSGASATTAVPGESLAASSSDG